MEVGGGGGVKSGRNGGDEKHIKVEIKVEIKVGIKVETGKISKLVKILSSYWLGSRQGRAVRKVVVG